MHQHCHTATMSPSRHHQQEQKHSLDGHVCEKDPPVNTVHVQVGAVAVKLHRRIWHSIRNAPFALMAPQVAVVSISSSSIIADAEKLHTETIVQTALLARPPPQKCNGRQQCPGTRPDLLKCLCRCWHAQFAWCDGHTGQPSVRCCSSRSSVLQTHHFCAMAFGQRRGCDMATSHATLTLNW